MGGTDSIVTAYVNHAPLVNILKITFARTMIQLRVMLVLGLAMAVLPQTGRARRANQEKHSNNLPIPTWNVKTVKYAGVAKLKLQRVPLLIILCAWTNVKEHIASKKKKRKSPFLHKLLQLQLHKLLLHKLLLHKLLLYPREDPVVDSTNPRENSMVDSTNPRENSMVDSTNPRK